MNDEKLCAKDFVALAIENAGTTVAKLQNLRLWLERHESADCSECRAVLRRVIQFVRLPNLREPPADIRRIRWACSEKEMSKMDAGPLEYLALASVVAAEQHPESFGPAIRAEAAAAPNENAVRRRTAGHAGLHGGRG